jgi:uncharacterized DUF497 family protein
LGSSDGQWRQIKVGWDIPKDALNRQRHPGFSLRDGIQIVANPLNKSEIQYENGEERERIIGYGANNIVLVVAVQWVDDNEQSMPTVRIISVRRAERREIRKMQMDEDVKPVQPRREPIDPDNPPLTGKEVWGRWGDRLNAKIKAHDAKVAARKATQTANPQAV